MMERELRLFSNVLDSQGGTYHQIRSAFEQEFIVQNKDMLISSQTGL